mgnify:CR=1 FL=1
MIKFFRKIRRQLLTENKFTKYLLYAIGEIVLVVIGILIALQINNANEKSKSEERTKQLLVKVQQELLLNIINANETIDYYRHRDSLVYKVVNRTVSLNDYNSNPRYFNLILEEPKMSIIDEAFKTFIESQDNLSEVQDSIALKLKKLYGLDKTLHDKNQQMTIDHLINFGLKLKNENEWFSDFIHYFEDVDKPDEITDYFLNDPFYLNEVTTFEMFGLVNHFPSIVFFRNRAIWIYENISDNLNLDKDNLIKKNPKDYQHYLGTYTSDSISCLIKEENNELMIYRINNIDKSVIDSSQLFPDSKKYFTYWNIFGELKLDENNEVYSLVLSRGFYRKEYVKEK